MPNSFCFLSVEMKSSLLLESVLCVCVCVRACVRACVRVRALVRARARARVRVPCACAMCMSYCGCACAHACLCMCLDPNQIGGASSDLIKFCMKPHTTLLDHIHAGVSV